MCIINHIACEQGGKIRGIITPARMTLIAARNSTLLCGIGDWDDFAAMWRYIRPVMSGSNGLREAHRWHV